MKFLYTLERYTEPLYNSNPVTMLDKIPGLMNAIRMINNYSRFYNTSEHMTALFVKVTNQMVTACKAYLTDNGYHTFWEQEHPVVLQRMASCMKLNEEFQGCYQRTKAKVAANPDERAFVFSEVYMFGRFNNFCKRYPPQLELVLLGYTQPSKPTVCWCYICVTAYCRTFDMQLFLLLREALIPLTMCVVYCVYRLVGEHGPSVLHTCSCRQLDVSDVVFK